MERTLSKGGVWKQDLPMSAIRRRFGRLGLGLLGVATPVFLSMATSAFAVPLSPDQKDGIMTRCLIAGGAPKVCCAAADDSLSPNSCTEKSDAAPAPDSKPAAAAQQPSKSKTGALDFSKIQEGPTPVAPTK